MSDLPVCSTEQLASSLDDLKDFYSTQICQSPVTQPSLQLKSDHFILQSRDTRFQSNLTPLRARFSKAKNQSSFQFPVMESKLHNGLKIYISPNDEAEDLYVTLNVAAGSAKEFIPGSAHLYEHLVFKGTGEIGTFDFMKEKPFLDEIKKVNEKMYALQCYGTKVVANIAICHSLQQEMNRLSSLASQYEIANEYKTICGDLGGSSLNGTTGVDETQYELTLPPDDLGALEKWAKTASHLIQKTEIRYFQTALEAVLEEHNQRQNDPDIVVWDKLIEKMFPEHPYGRFNSETLNGLKNPSISKIKEFADRNYVPNQMAVVISGKMKEPEKVKRMIEKYFGSLVPSKISEESIPKPKPLRGVQREDINFPGKDNKVIIGFRISPFNSPDRAALIILDRLLTDASYGTLREKLEIPMRLKSVNSSLTFFKDGGLIEITGTLNPGQTHAEGEALLLSELEAIKNGVFSKEHLKDVITNYNARRQSALESNEYRVERIIEGYISGLSKENFLLRIDSVRQEEVRAVAEKYFGNNYVVLYRHNKPRTDLVSLDKSELPPISLNLDRKSRFAQEVESIPSSPAELRLVTSGRNGDYQLVVLHPGMHLYYKQNQSNDLSELSFVYEYGNRPEDKLFCDVMEAANQAGISFVNKNHRVMHLRAEEVAKRFYSLATSVEQECGDYNFQINLRGIQQTLPEALALAERQLWHAEIDSEDFKKFIKNKLDLYQGFKSNTDKINNALAWYTLLGKRSWSQQLPKVFELKSLKGQEDYLKRKEELAKQHFSVYYTGPLSIEAVEKLIRKYHPPMSSSSALLTASKVPPLVFVTPPKEPLKIYFTQADSSTQAKINFYILQEKQDGNIKKNVMINVLNSYFGARRSGINVFYNYLRDAKGLGYSVGGKYIKGSALGDESFFEAYVNLQNNKAAEAVMAMNLLLKNLPLTEELFISNKQRVKDEILRKRFSRKNLLDQVTEWREVGYFKDPRAEYLREIDALTFKDFQQFVHESIENRNYRVTIVGNRKNMDMDQLKKMGSFEEITIDQLFPY